MHNKEKLSDSEDKDGMVSTPENQSLGIAPNGGKPAKDEVKTKGSKPKRENPKEGNGKPTS